MDLTAGEAPWPFVERLESDRRAAVQLGYRVGEQAMSEPMTAAQFFEHPVVQFPMERDKDDFELFVGQRLQAYVDLIRDMNPSDNITKQIKDALARIKELCGSLKMAIREYMRGLPHKAYARLNEGIKGVQADFSRFPGPVDHPFIRELYRMRVEEAPGVTFGKPDLFHIPFDSREKVARQRYSIPGLPCLYLGGSLYVCWEELRRPRFESIHLARFEIVSEERVNILDFMQRPRHMAAGVKANPAMANEILHLRNGYCALAVCWPLMATAAIRPKHGNAPFIAEYIIPQLILQWITENDDSGIDGIGYSSVRCKTHVDYPAVILNLVFPAKKITASGHCAHLRRKFAMTDPIAWHLLESVRNDFPRLPSAGDSSLELIAGMPTCYNYTAFGALEGKLRALKATAL
jgi:hypothetical protein